MSRSPHSRIKAFISISERIPRRVKEKSYFTGSSGDTARKASVISMAEARLALDREVRPRLLQMLNMWVSRGTMRDTGLTDSHPPGSTSSRRTIHLRKRWSLLHALFARGEGMRVRHASSHLSSRAK
jgi:hypothetical protein